MMRSIFGIFLVLLMAVPQVSAQLNSYSRSELAFDNALAGYNPGFESGTVKWTASGGTFAVNSGTQFVPGSKQFASWDSNSASQEVCSALVKVPESGNCSVGLEYRVPSGTATHKIVAKDGSKDLAIEDVVSSTSAMKHEVEFPCAAAASNQARVCLRSVASDEPAIHLDGGYAGEARQVSREGALGPTTHYTPTLNSMTGVLAVNGTKQRVGDGYNLVIGVAYNGTGANATFSASVPSDCTIDNSKLPITSTFNSNRNGIGFWGWYDDSGGQAIDDQWVRTNTSSTMILVRGSNSVNSNIFANGDQLVINVRVPCVGFAPSTISTPEQQRAPKVTHYLSGSGTHTWSNGVTHATIEIIGGGGGGGGAGASSPTAGGTGGTTTFDGVNAPGGAGGSAGANGSGGNAGAATAVPCTTNESFTCRGGAPGGAGTVTDSVAATQHAPGGHGGQSRFGGAGMGQYESSGLAAQANTGSGGAGGAGDAGAYRSGAGGSVGADITWHRVAPSGTASYSVGAAGAAGTGTRNGGAGGSGYIKVTEYFGYTTAILANSVSTQVTNGLKVESAKLTTTTGPNACAITSQFGTWLTGTPSSSGAGQCSFTIATGTFSSAPNCKFNVFSGGSAISATGNASSATAASFQIWDALGAGATGGVVVECLGPR